MARILKDLVKSVKDKLFHESQGLRDFDEELKKFKLVGTGRDRGVQPVNVNKIVGSVSRADDMNSKFFYKKRKPTQRFKNIGKAMDADKVLPPIDVYKLKVEGKSEYYVIDGHHRVAMAKKKGQLDIDANIVEYKIKPKEKGSEESK